MKRTRLVMLAIASFVTLSLFQNCTSDGHLDIEGGQNSSISPSNTPGDEPTPPEKISNFSCQHFVILELSNPLVVPARDASTGICYAVQIFQAIPNGSSSLTSLIDNDVISLNHDSTDPENHHPYLMGQATAAVKFEGLRNIKLAGSSSDDSAPIKIDNFALVGFKAINGPTGSASDLSPSDYAAFGTADSTIGSTNGIQMSDQLVPLTSFGPWGTATVSALDISQAIVVNQYYVLDIRAEDAGGARELSDVFVIFE